MASIHCGQKALIPLPPKAAKVQTVADTILSKSLQVSDRSAVKEEGMLVYKVGKNGKLQARRLAFSKDHRTMWVTSHKVKSVGRGLLQLVGAGGGSSTSSGGGLPQPANVQAIDVSRMDHVLQGQLTKRFGLARADIDNHSESNDSGGLNLVGGVRAADALSMSLLYRDSGTRLGGNGNSNTTTAGESTLESLDLIIPDSSNYQELWNAFEDLLAMYQKQRSNSERTTLLLEYLWLDLGKPLGTGLFNGEWLDFCDRLNVPLKNGQCTSLYKEVTKHLRQKRALANGGGLPLWAVSELLNDVRFHSMEAAGLKLVHQDPLLRVWYETSRTDPVPAMEDGNAISPTSAAQSISSVAFLSFLRSQQKEFQTSLEDVVGMIHVLNRQTSSNPKRLAANDSSPTKEDRLSKAQFLQYLLGDANDLLDPARGKVGSDDMSQPLSHYWICSSHDTYMNHWGRTRTNTVPVYDEQTYLAALYRGVRCLELDVWDWQDEPVICQEQPKTTDEPYLSVPSVLKVIRQFLLAYPKSYPVILNIENHCEYANQERLATYLFRILGKNGLIVVPDDTASMDEADLLPSPKSMRGKVLVMGKRPKVITEGAKVINDDFDDENDRYDTDELPNAVSRDMEEAQLDQGIVIGFDSGGPIKADKDQEKNIVQHSTGELLYMAKQDLEQAKLDAVEAELNVLKVNDEADQAEAKSDELIERTGLTKHAVLELALQVKGNEIDPKEHVALLAARAEGEGVEVQEFFADGVEAARATFTDADQLAIEAASIATESLQRLNQATTKLREAEGLLEKSYTKEREMVADYQRAAGSARSQTEDAEYSKRRVEKVRQLLNECENSAASAENVVVTAMTEAKISEKRASETEARAARASTKTKEDRKRADEETRKEEILEREAAILHEQLMDANRRANELQKAMDKAASSIDRVNEQLKLIEQSTPYAREVRDRHQHFSEEKKDATPVKGKLIAKHASKMEERSKHSATIQKKSTEHKEYEKKRRKLQESFEKKAHLWKNQTEVASKLRKVADRIAHTAEELAEHAEEEREAANLRHTAREKAKTNVSEKDSYRNSLKAQLKEAERAAKEAEGKAQISRKSADALEHVNNDLPTHEKNVRFLERRKAARDHAWEDYEGKKRRKEEAEAKAAEAKQRFDTSESIFSQAMRNAAQEDRKADFQRQTDRTALVAFNQARLLRKQAEHALEDVRYAQGVVTERQLVIKRATEYSEKMARITPIPMSLAKMTFLHTTKHRHWDKSFDIPNTHVHSFAQGVLDEMKERDSQNPDRLKDFSTEHICRTFPSWKDMKGQEKINSDPLFLWALGCQLVSLNYSTFDEHILKADGRFRRNGSSGYVLKPENLTHDDPLRERQETWSIDILCGSCLPSPESSAKRSTINPFVKLSVYGGDIEGKSIAHRTKVVMKNGINPIWDEKDGLTFTLRNPSLSICVFSVWHKGEQGEEFIAASALPASCMRDGIRSIALFDMYHTRSGPHAFASLLVKATKAT